MSQWTIGSIRSLTIVIFTLALTGCPVGRLPDTAVLSSTEPVSVSATATVEVSLGAGAPMLADSTWSIHRSSDDALLFRISFGPDGDVTRLFDNFLFGDPWLGNEIIPDAMAHRTAFAGGRYVSGAYAAEQDGNVGVLGVLHGILFGQHLGTAKLSFWGEVEGDRIEGSMVRTVTILAETPFPAPGNAEFNAYALRQP